VENLTGRSRLVCYLRDFGAQGYFVNIPSKFIHPDGRTMWLCLSANFTNDRLSTYDPVDLPGGGFGMCLQGIKLLS
jgi:hypothetical protein